MSDVVIKVENLSKSYMISHQKSERYTALRDVITNKGKAFSSKVFSLFTNHKSVSQLPSLSSGISVAMQHERPDPTNVTGDETCKRYEC